MDFLTILAFSIAVFLFMASPGPGTFAIIARALGSGFRNAFSMSLGMAIGDLTFLLLAVFGLSAIAHIMGDIFTIVKYIGGLYLLYLGVKIFISKPTSDSIKSTKSKSLTGDFISGYLIAVSNPKVILFYLGFLPTFVNLKTLTSVDIFLISSLVVGILTVVLGSYAYFASKARATIKKPKTQIIMNRVAGSVMFAAGTALLIKH